jgi:hypothetical protein
MITFGLLLAMFGDWTSSAVRRSIRRFIVRTSPRVASAVASEGAVPPGERRAIGFSPCIHELLIGLTVSPRCAPHFVIESIRTARVEILPEGISADLLDGADLDWPRLSPGSFLTITVRNLDKDAAHDFRAAIWGVAL